MARDPKTTAPDFANRNHQRALRSPDLPGNDHDQRAYVLASGPCGSTFGANRFDALQRKRPAYQRGAPGSDFDNAAPAA